MKVLILTSTEARHMHLVKKALAKGYEVLAWAEAKGQDMNQGAFEKSDYVILLQLHRESLENSFQDYFPPVDSKALPMTVYSRGAFHDQSLVSQAKDFAPDVVISYGCGIIGEGLLNLFDQRIIGSHQGLPQYYRGSGSNYFAFLNGQAAFMGVSVHLVDQGIDTGQVITQYTDKPTAAETYYSFSARLVNETMRLYLEVLDKVRESSATEVFRDTKTLPFEGRLYQRQDFTPESIVQCFRMQLAKSFSWWHEDSRKKYGPPVIL